MPKKKLPPHPQGASSRKSGESDAAPEIPNERLDLQILRSIRKIMRSADRYSKKLANEHGITLPQLICLNKVVEQKSITVKHLAQEIFLSPSTIVGITDRLEKRGLVTRNRSLSDRRSVSIIATEKGIQVSQDSPPLLQDAFIHALNLLPTSDQRNMARSLSKVVELMEIDRVDASPILETRTDL